MQHVLPVFFSNAGHLPHPIQRGYRRSHVRQGNRERELIVQYVCERQQKEPYLTQVTKIKQFFNFSRSLRVTLALPRIGAVTWSASRLGDDTPLNSKNTQN